MGEADVDAMLERIGPDMLDEWMQRSETRPLGFKWLAQILAGGFSDLFNAQTGGNTKPADFLMLPDSSPSVTEQTPEDQIAIARQYASRFRRGA